MLDDNDKEIIETIVKEVKGIGKDVTELRNDVTGLKNDVTDLKFHQRVTDQKYNLLMKEINNYYNSKNRRIKETDYMRRLRDGSCVL